MSRGDVVGRLIQTLEFSIAAVEAKEKHEDACCTLVAPTMKGTGIRPEVVSETKKGERVYLLTVAQARKLLARALDARDTLDTKTTKGEQ